MKIITYTSTEREQARLAKFRKKAPKKPKLTSSTMIKERFIDRYNAWVKELKEAAKRGKIEYDLREQIRNAKR